MAGNPDNAILWDRADVYTLKPNVIGDNETIYDYLPDSIDAEFPPEWDLVGLLSGDAGFGEERNWDETDHSAWGYGVIKVGSRNFAMSRTWTSLEPENDTNRYLYSPGDTATKIKVAKPAQVHVAFEKISDTGEKFRQISTRPSRVTAPSKTDNEADLASLEFTARIFPNTDYELFIKQDAGTVVDEVSVLPATASIAVGATQQLAAEATYESEETEDVTRSATYVSSDPTKATVSNRGLVTGVAAGSTTVTISYQGSSDTVAVTVTA